LSVEYSRLGFAHVHPAVLASRPLQAFVMDELESIGRRPSPGAADTDGTDVAPTETRLPISNAAAAATFRAFMTTSQSTWP